MKRMTRYALSALLLAALLSAAAPVAAAPADGWELPGLTSLTEWLSWIGIHIAAPQGTTPDGTDAAQDPTIGSPVPTDSTQSGPTGDPGGDTETHPLVDPDG